MLLGHPMLPLDTFGSLFHYYNSTISVIVVPVSASLVLDSVSDTRPVPDRVPGAGPVTVALSRVRLVPDWCWAVLDSSAVVTGGPVVCLPI